MSSRPVLKGFIKFNLVTIPVGVYTATSGQMGIALNQLHKNCGQRIRYKKTCPVHGEVEQHQIVSGYQFDKDQYVIVDDGEKKAAMPKNEKAVTIAGFVRPDCIDLCYFTDRHYYLLPDGDVGRKPYALLRQAMVDAKRHALAQVAVPLGLAHFVEATEVPSIGFFERTFCDSLAYDYRAVHLAGMILPTDRAWLCLGYPPPDRCVTHGRSLPPGRRSRLPRFRVSTNAPCRRVQYLGGETVPMRSSGPTSVRRRERSASGSAP